MLHSINQQISKLERKLEKYHQHSNEEVSTLQKTCADIASKNTEVANNTKNPANDHNQPSTTCIGDGQKGQ
ncbi:hypothetical protein EB796_013051 [Bugula neritina]|uniref:Uncharacterized protein n=1 Tax=Bugula neritina TaxID=10212 RepID=A0A7J7JTD0_BUGNE|nr:hypothetical protein EB796_013051 [Bugula neritina]